MSRGILHTLLIIKNNFQGGRRRGGKKKKKEKAFKKLSAPVIFSSLKKQERTEKHPWCVVKISTKELFLPGSFSKRKGALIAFLGLANLTDTDG